MISLSMLYVRVKYICPTTVKTSDSIWFLIPKHVRQWLLPITPVIFTCTQLYVSKCKILSMPTHLKARNSITRMLREELLVHICSFYKFQNIIQGYKTDFTVLSLLGWHAAMTLNWKGMTTLWTHSNCQTQKTKLTQNTPHLSSCTTIHKTGTNHIPAPFQSDTFFSDKRAKCRLPSALHHFLKTSHKIVFQNLGKNINLIKALGVHPKCPLGITEWNVSPKRLVTMSLFAKCLQVQLWLASKVILN